MTTQKIIYDHSKGTCQTHTIPLDSNKTESLDNQLKNMQQGLEDQLKKMQEINEQLEQQLSQQPKRRRMIFNEAGKLIDFGAASSSNNSNNNNSNTNVAKSYRLMQMFTGCNPNRTVNVDESLEERARKYAAVQMHSASVNNTPDKVRKSYELMKFFVG
jgi:hypothetical protein